MGLKELKIIFDNPVYHPGETVKGKLFIVLDTPQKYRGIRITLKGVAQTSWRVSKKESDNTQRRIGKNSLQSESFGQEVYFSRRFYIAGVYAGETELSSGEHEHSFEYELPQNLPSSFESEFGYIRYTAKAIFDFPWRFDQEIEHSFKVVSHYDLNTEPRAMKSVIEEKSKTFGCCCTSSPISVNLSIPVRGFVSGQSIPVKVDIENESGIKICNVKVTLQKHVVYRVKTPRADEKMMSFIEVEVSKGPIEDKGIISYEHVLKVPDLQPSTLNACGIIDVNYTLNLEADVEGWRRRNLKMVTPILIGTVPLDNYQSLFSPQQQNGQNKEKVARSSPCGAVFYTKGEAPPTYEESVLKMWEDSNEFETSLLIPK